MQVVKIQAELATSLACFDVELVGLGFEALLHPQLRQVCSGAAHAWADRERLQVVALGSLEVRLWPHPADETQICKDECPTTLVRIP